MYAPPTERLGSPAPLTASTFLLLGDHLRAAVPWLIATPSARCRRCASRCAQRRTHSARAGALTLAGVLAFFLLEKLVLWRHYDITRLRAHGVARHHGDASTPAQDRRACSVPLPDPAGAPTSFSVMPSCAPVSRSRNMPIPEHRRNPRRHSHASRLGVGPNGAAVRPLVRGWNVPLRRDVRSHSRPAPGRSRGWTIPPAVADHGGRRDDYPSLNPFPVPLPLCLFPFQLAPSLPLRSLPERLDRRSGSHESQKVGWTGSRGVRHRVAPRDGVAGMGAKPVRFAHRRRGGAASRGLRAVFNLRPHQWDGREWRRDADRKSDDAVQEE